MKKHWSLFYLSLVLILVPATSSLSSDVFVLSGNPNAPPIVWEENEKLMGLAPDIAEQIFKKLTLSYDLRRFGNWENVQTKTKNGKIDMIVSAYKNAERQEYLLFSVPYLTQPIVIIVQQGNEFKLSGWDSLIGKKGVSNVGESYGDAFDAFIKEKLDVSYYEYERAIQLLNLGEADYLIIDLFTAIVYTRMLHGEDAVTILDPPITVQEFHFAIRKDSALAAHLPGINKELAAKVESGEVRDTFFKYFDKWKQLIDRRAAYFAADKKIRTEEQETYLKEQGEWSHQQIIQMMTVTEGLPPAAN